MYTIKVSQLRVGDRLDLEGDRIADPKGQNLAAREQFAVVTVAVNTVAPGFRQVSTSIGTFTFPSDHPVRIAALMYREHFEQFTSGDLESMGYYPKQQILEVNFRRQGAVYQYFDVTPEKYEIVRKSCSMGSALHVVIQKEAHAYRRVA